MPSGRSTPLVYSELRRLAGPLTLERLKEDLLKQLPAGDEAFGFQGVPAARVFSVGKGEHENRERRRGRKLTGACVEVFSALQELLTAACPGHCTFRWHVLQGHYDVLLYEEGDVFLRHRDFLPVASRLLEPYTLLLCLEGCCSGGKTVLWLPGGESVESDASCTTGDALVFRADLEHEGGRVIAGRKLILRADLLRLPASQAPPSTLPYFQARESFLELSQASPACEEGSSQEEAAAALAYAAGSLFQPEETSALKHILDYYGCREASLSDEQEWRRLVERGIAIAAQPQKNEDVERIWEAGHRSGCCSLLLLFAYTQSQPGARRWLEAGVWAFFSDGTPAKLEGLVDQQQRLLGGGERSLELLSAAELEGVAQMVFGEGREPRAMASNLALWLCEALLGCQHLGSAGPEATKRGWPSHLERGLEGDDRRTPWRLAVEARLEEAIEACRSKLQMAEDPDASVITVSEEEEYCNDGDYITTSHYCTTEMRGAWCLLRAPSSTEVP